MGEVEAVPHVAASGVPPSHRYKGSGGPLVCESWQFRPASVGWFMGMIQGGTLIDDWVVAKGGFFGGYRLGWDCGHYWGYEMRLALGNLALSDSHLARQAQEAADDEKGFAPTDPFRDRFDARRDATTTLWDMSLLYYPWGDAVWRPYLMAGMGVARVKFIDRLSIRYDECVLGVPFGLGVKYRAGPRLAFRLELADNIAFGSSFNTVHHVTFTGGLELRFGGGRVAYWPWEPGRHYW